MNTISNDNNYTENATLSSPEEISAYNLYAIDGCSQSNTSADQQVYIGFYH